MHICDILVVVIRIEAWLFGEETNHFRFSQEKTTVYAYLSVFVGKFHFLLFWTTRPLSASSNGRMVMGAVINLKNQF